MGDVLRLVFVHLLESSNSQPPSGSFKLLWRSMTNFEKVLGDIAICLSDMTSFATEWQPSEAALEACLPRKETATCGRCPYCCSVAAGLLMISS